MTVRPETRLALVAAAAFAVVCGPPARAQDYVRADCAAVFAGQPAPRFDHAEHGLWYRRFWTGDCTGLSWCQSGAPYWNEMVPGLLRRVAPPRRAAVTVKACRLGRVVGHEWAKDNAIRRIDTGDLQGFVRDLQAPGDAEAALAAVERTVLAKMGR